MKCHFQFSSVAQSCPTLGDPMNRSMPGLPVHHQLPEFTQTQVHRVSDVMSHLILCHPLLLLPSSSPSIRVFPMRQFFTSGDQSTGASTSASVLPMNTRGWFPLRLTDLIVWFESPRDSQKPCPEPRFESNNSSALSLLYGPTLTCIHDYWKNHNFD